MLTLTDSTVKTVYDIDLLEETSRRKTTVFHDEAMSFRGLVVDDEIEFVVCISGKDVAGDDVFSGLFRPPYNQWS